MTQKRERGLYELRARLLGRGFWLCPDCGHENHLHLHPTSRFRVRCKYEYCHSTFTVGLIFYRQGSGGQRGTPRDTLLPAFQESELAPEPYRSRMAVHRLRQAENGGSEVQEQGEKSQSGTTSASDLSDSGGGAGGKGD